MSSTPFLSNSQFAHHHRVKESLSAATSTHSDAKAAFFGTPFIRTCFCTFLLLSIPLFFIGCKRSADSGSNKEWKVESDGAYHVHPGDRIQDAIDAAAGDPSNKVVKVHAGTYRPNKPGQALIWFNRRHEGVKVLAVGDVTLSAANPEVADKSDSTFPALVNHVVYFGHQVSNQTELVGFTITGANSCLNEGPDIEIEQKLPEKLTPGLFYFSDGGAIKIYGSSAPTLKNLKIVDNEARICAGGISVEQRGASIQPVSIINCVFKNNRCPGTGAAIDLLEGSRAKIENCLFVNNVGNYGMDEVAREYKLSYNPKHGCGALTVFEKSYAIVKNCTFTKNWNGVDDRGTGSRYENCIFWMNNASDGSRFGDPYEMDIRDGSAKVLNCSIHGVIPDLQKTIPESNNLIKEVDPEFDEMFVPRSAKHRELGYRPSKTDTE